MNNITIKDKTAFLDLIMENPEDQDKFDREKATTYRLFKIKKHNGDRHIYAIKPTSIICKYQQNLYKNFLTKLLFPECVCGFRKDRSYFDFLVPHISKQNKRYYLRLDISDFFESIQLSDVKDCFQHYLNDDMDEEVKDDICNYFIKIENKKGKIVQGAVTSPAISNLVFRSLDIRITRYCQRFGITYTRYADDLLFSCNRKIIFSYSFQKCIQAILSDKGFTLNLDKTLKYKDELSLNGYVIGENIRLSRKKVSKLNKVLFELSQSNFAELKSERARYILINKLAGYRAFFINSMKYIGDPVRTEKIANKINQIEKTIDKIRTLPILHN